jgi:hypothetical protein
MITFYPTWLTPVGLLPGSVTQNVSANIQLAAVRMAQCMGSDDSVTQAGSQTVLEIGTNSANVNLILVNGDAVSFTILSNAVQFTHTLLPTDIFSIYTSDVISYSLLYNSLPPGLSISSTGLISGLVGLIPSLDPLIYTFAIRITDGFFSRDRQLSINAIPVSTVVVPPGWGALPSQITAAAGFQYYPLGSTNRGEPFLYQFSLYEPNGLQPYLTLGNFTGSESITAPFNAFPTGLVLNNRTGLITGSVNTVLPVGQYFFKLTMTDSNNDPITSGSGATPLVCGIQVNPPFNILSPFEKVIWNTYPGSLGTLISGTICAMSVSAFCTTGGPVSYRVISSSLPPNLILNSLNGNIEGTLGFISTNQIYTFAIRAFVDGAYADRTFSISTQTLYYNNEFLEMDFLLRVNDKKPMENYYNTVISPSSIFRPTDQNFINTYTIFLLRASIPVSFQSVASQSNYDRPIKLILGDHALAYAVINGNVAYEVLYRPVYDPLEKAGGYTLINNVPVIDPVIYPESLSGHPQYVYPTSINNIRYEFVNALGIPATNPAFRHALGIGTAENLPLWMTSPQGNNNPASALGYIPALVVAYLKPGTGATILNNIRQRHAPIEQSYDSPNPMANGYEIWFDQYYVLYPGDSTTFDGNQTIFDLTTRFFSPDFSQKQLIRMPPYIPESFASMGTAIGNSSVQATSL